MEINKIKVCQAKLKEYKADCLILISDINRKWFNGVESDFGFTIVTPKESYILLDPRDIENAYKYSPKEAKKVLYTQISDYTNLVKKIKPKSILIEADLISLKQYDSYINIFKTNIVRFDSVELRNQKTSEEIKNIKKAMDIAASGVEYLKKFIKPGVSEKQAAKELLLFFIKNGASAESFPAIVLYGDHSYDIHGMPTDRKYKKGENILLDCGCVYNGYCSDITRCWGSNDKYVKKVYEIVKNANLLGIKLIKSGVNGAELDAQIREYVSTKFEGYNIPHGIGHGVGLAIHENPRISKIYPKAILENSVVTIEPGIYLKDKFGIRVEDSVLVTKTNCEVLTKKSSKEYK